MKKRLITTVITAIIVSFSPVLFGQVKLPAIFNDHMILQREAKVPVWGTAQPGELIRVELAGKNAKTVVAADGKWKVHLPSMKAGGPYLMKIYQGPKSQVALEYKEVLIGDVWLASGQSNMEWQVQQSHDAANEIRQAQYPEIRFFNVTHDKKASPQDTLFVGSWKKMDDTLALKNASAVAYYFARNLQADLKVPVGIVQSTWGGTPVEAWTSRAALLSSSVTKDQVAKSDSLTGSHFVQDSLNLLRFWNIVYNPQDGVGEQVSKIDFNDTKWPVITMPAVLKEKTMPDYEGIVWLRKEIDIEEKFNTTSIRLELGHPEMNYTLYFNGQEIAKNIWNNNKSHAYDIPAHLIRQSKNVIAVRMAFLWTGGGFNPPAEQMYLTDGQLKVSLAGNWKYQKNLEPPIPKIRNYHQYPSVLFNGMINPIVPYAIKGFIWYQGEDNAVAPLAYRTSFPLLISDWRTRWKQGDLPFLYVQLANFMKQQSKPSESNWALLREAQTMTLKVPNTGMATAIDIGNPDDIHPANKQEVGRRLALAAKKLVYHQKIQASGPMYQKHELDGNQVKITFTETGSGLKVKDAAELKGFAIAGMDKVFHWADAEIAGNSVILTSAVVKEPVHIRYAWADSPECNLINQEGLPAVPFRTDQ